MHFYLELGVDNSLTKRTNRGYTIGSMDRNILVWDGSVGWTILKNKVRLMLEFDDIQPKS